MVNQIVLKGTGIQKEAPAGGAITPGHLVSLTSTGTVVVHAVVGGTAQRAFARENSNVGASMDTAYALNDTVTYVVMPHGAEVNALVAAGAAAIVKGDFLQSAGNGTVQKYVQQADTSGTPAVNIRVQQVVGIALAAVDNSLGATSVRLAMEVL